MQIKQVTEQNKAIKLSAKQKVLLIDSADGKFLHVRAPIGSGNLRTLVGDEDTTLNITLPKGDYEGADKIFFSDEGEATSFSVKEKPVTTSPQEATRPKTGSATHTKLNAALV